MTSPIAARAARGILLMTYGSPSSLDDVERYITAVRGGRRPDDELVAEFRRRYEVIGGSPLIEITVAQAAAVEARLAAQAGGRIPVRAAMRFSEPTIEASLRELVDAGAADVVGIIMSPQFSPLLMGGYQRALDAAKAALPPRAKVDIRLAGAWHRQPEFIAAVADRVREGLARFGPDERDSVPVLLTAHSLPKRVAEQEPDYLGQLRETAEAIAAAAGLAPERWAFCWQSAGHEPGEWMKPDFSDLMPDLKAAGHRTVLVAPVQFLADHLEVLYDVDIGAREQAEASGLEFRRIESLNVSPRFVATLAAVAAEAFGPGAGAHAVDAGPRARA